MMSIDDFFYGNMKPTWITRSKDDFVYSDHQYSTYNVSVVELSVPQCCTKQCEEKIKSCLFRMQGVDQVIVDYHNQKVTVTGNASPEKILRQIKKVKKRARIYIRKQYGQL